MPYWFYAFAPYQPKLEYWLLIFDRELRAVLVMAFFSCCDFNNFQCYTGKSVFPVSHWVFLSNSSFSSFYQVFSLPSVSSTRCFLYQVLSLPGVFSTRCFLYQVLSLPSVFSTTSFSTRCILYQVFLYQVFLVLVFLLGVFSTRYFL